MIRNEKNRANSSYIPASGVINYTLRAISELRLRSSSPPPNIHGPVHNPVYKFTGAPLLPDKTGKTRERQTGRRKGQTGRSRQRETDKIRQLGFPCLFARAPRNGVVSGQFALARPLVCSQLVASSSFSQRLLGFPLLLFDFSLAALP